MPPFGFADKPLSYVTAGTTHLPSAMITNGRVADAAPALETTPLLSNESCPPKPVHIPVDESESKPTAEPASESFGYVLLLISALFFCTMGLLLRLATGYHGLPVSTVLFVRGVIQSLTAIFIIVCFMDYRKAFSLSRRLCLLLFLRGFLGATSMLFTFSALALLPLGIQASLFFLNPIFTLILSSIALGEAFGGVELLAALIGFTGVVLVSNPTLQINFVQGHSSSYVLGCSLALLAAVTVAVTYVILRSFASRIHFMVSVLSLGTFVAIYGILTGGSSIETMRKYPYAFRLVLFASVLGFAGTCCLNKGFQYCRAGTGTLMRNIDVPIAYLLGIVFLDEVPHVVSLLGSALVISGTVLVGGKKLLRK